MNRKLFILTILCLTGCFTKEKSPYTIYYGDRVFLELAPTGDKRCDELKLKAVSLFTRQVEEFRLKTEKQRKEAEVSGLDKSGRLAGVELGERMALPEMQQITRKTINSALKEGGCLSDNSALSSL